MYNLRNPNRNRPFKKALSNFPWSNHVHSAHVVICIVWTEKCKSQNTERCCTSLEKYETLQNVRKEVRFSIMVEKRNQCKWNQNDWFVMCDFDHVRLISPNRTNLGAPIVLIMLWSRRYTLSRASVNGSGINKIGRPRYWTSKLANLKMGHKGINFTSLFH